MHYIWLYSKHNGFNLNKTEDMIPRWRKQNPRLINCDVYLYSYLVLENTENRHVSTVFRATLETHFVSLDNCPHKSLCVLTLEGHIVWSPQKYLAKYRCVTSYSFPCPSILEISRLSGLDDYYEPFVEWYWQGEVDTSEKNLSQCRFAHDGMIWNRAQSSAMRGRWILRLIFFKILCKR